MDKELAAASAHARLMELALIERASRLDKTTSRLSRHYNRVAHTDALLAALKDLQGMIEQDPDLWSTEEEQIPF